jgi:hypothetical protein
MNHSRNPNKRNKSLVSIIEMLFVLLAVCIIFIKGSPFGDPGVGWHLRTGQWITEHWKFIYSDIFLVNSHSLEWISNQWLSDVVFWSIYVLGEKFKLGSGLPLLHVFTAILVLIPIAFILFPLTSRVTRSLTIALVALAVIAVIGSSQWFFRPVLFSFIGFALCYRLLESRYFLNNHSSEKFQVFFFKFILIFSIWANLHPGFVLGLGLIAFALLAIIIEKRQLDIPEVKELIFLGIVSTIATFLNPYGIKIYQDALSLIGSEYFMKLNIEWYPPELSDSFFLPFFILAGVFIAIFAFTFLRKQFRKNLNWNYFEIITVIVFTILSLKTRRYIPFFAIVSYLPLVKLLMLSSLLSDSKFSYVQPRFVLYWLFFVVISTFTLIQGHIPFRNQEFSNIDQFYPADAVTHIQMKKIEGTIFATPDWGGYLAWRFYPESRVFIDDRNQLNGVERYQDYFLAIKAQNDSDWRRVFEKYQIEVALLSPKTQLVKKLEKDKNWKLDFSDKDYLVYRKNIY